MRFADMLLDLQLLIKLAAANRREFMQQLMAGAGVAKAVSGSPLVQPTEHGGWSPAGTALRAALGTPTFSEGVATQAMPSATTDLAAKVTRREALRGMVPLLVSPHVAGRRAVNLIEELPGSSIAARALTGMSGMAGLHLPEGAAARLLSLAAPHLMERAQSRIGARVKPLLKRSALYSPSHPSLNQQLQLERARREEIPVNMTGGRMSGELFGPAWTYPIGGGRSRIDLHPGSTGIGAKLLTFGSSPSLDMTLPSATGDILTHELDEADLIRRQAAGKAGVGVGALRSVDPATIRRLEDATAAITPPRNLSVPQQYGWEPKIMDRARHAMAVGAYRKDEARGGVAHMGLPILLRESNRAAGGEVSPEHFNQLMAARKATGELDALHSLGIAYGKQVIPEGGRVWNRALQRFHTETLVPPSESQALPATYYNLRPLMDKRRAAREKFVPTRMQQAAGSVGRGLRSVWSKFF